MSNFLLTSRETRLLLWALGAAAVASRYQCPTQPATVGTPDILQISHLLAGGFEEVALAPGDFDALLQFLEQLSHDFADESPEGFSRDLQNFAANLRSSIYGSVRLRSRGASA